MIKGILFAVLFIILFTAIGLAILFGVKHSKSSTKLYNDLSEIKRKYQNKVTYGTPQKEISKLNEECAAEMQEYNAKHKPKGFKAMIASIAVSIAALGLVITIPGSFHQVEAGTYAVVKQVGKIVDVKSPGTYFDFYMTKKYEIYDATVQQVKINTESYSKDGQTMKLELYLQYTIQLDKLILKDEKGNIIQTEGIAGKFGSLASLQTRIEAQCIEKTKAVMSDAPAMTIIQERANYSKKVSEDVTAALKEGFYVNVQDVVLTNIDFTDEFEKSVEDKVVAEQQKQASITKAEAELEVATLSAKKKIEEAHGAAESQKIIAQASAEAATYKIVELAKVIGYKVTSKYNYKTTITESVYNDSELSKLEKTETTIKMNVNEDNSDIVDLENEHPELVKTTVKIEKTEGKDEWTKIERSTILYSKEYSIDITKMNGELVTLKDGESYASVFNKLVESYLQYLAYLEQWNGELPQVVAGDDAMSIIVPGKGE